MTEGYPYIYNFSRKEFSRTVERIKAEEQLQFIGITTTEERFRRRCRILGSQEMGLFFDWDGTFTLIGEGRTRPQFNSWVDLQAAAPGWNQDFAARLKQNHLASMTADNAARQMLVSEQCVQLYREAGLTWSGLLDVAGNIILRPGFREFIIEQAEGFKRKIAVISYGVYQVIQSVLENYGIHNLVTLYAEKFAFRGNELMGIDTTAPRMVPALKGRIAGNFLAEHQLVNAVGFGDSQGDYGLLIAAQLGILFLHNRPSSPIHLPEIQKRMHAGADVFVVNTGDDSFQQVPALFNRFIKQK